VPRVPLIVALTVAMLVLSAGDALARGKGGPLCKGNLDKGYAYAEAFAGTLSLRPLVVNGDNTPRRLVGVPSPASSQALLGAGFGFGFRCDYVMFHLISVRYATALDTGVSGTGTADNGVVHVERDTLQTLAIAFPTFGLPSGFQLFPSDASKLTFSYDLGVERIWADATVSGAGVPPSAGSIDTWDFYMRTQAAGCVRIGATIPKVSQAWGCVTVAAVVYDRSPFPGFTAGVRVDL